LGARLALLNDLVKQDDSMVRAQKPTAHKAPINLSSFGSRFDNEQGAREGWEQMIAWLVRLDHPTAERIEANGQGDGGIDVLVGNLTGGEITIWQAKYVRVIDDSQKKQIRGSFRSALDSAAERGNHVVRWVLCVPINLDIPGRKWWEQWRADNQRLHNVRIDLWGETELVRLIARPKAADLHAYYFSGAYDHDSPSIGPSTASLVSVPSSAEPADEVWTGGGLVRLGSDSYLLHDGSTERPGSADHSVLWREGVASHAGHGTESIYLSQVRIVRPSPASAEQRAGLGEQARVLKDLAGRGGLPRLLATHESGHGLTVVTVQPPGRAWREVFGPGPGPLDRISAARVCAASVSLGEALAELHHIGHSHRALSPGTVVVSDHGRRARLRHGGLVAVPPTIGEGCCEYAAPEQMVGHEPRQTVGPPTDIYQFGALLYQTITSHRPSGARSPSMRATNPDVPERLDEMLRRCLDPDPRQRPDTLRPIIAALADARRLLSAGPDR
jgi:hypothetical protein